MSPTILTDRLLDEIDTQQAELLWRLDELNDRVERTIREQLLGQGKKEA
jgi:hypothetical protein